MNKETKENSSRQGIVKLSGRLKQIADFVRPGSRVADIGTDHGYVPVYLAQTGRIISALAMDVGKGPLERAGKHIEAYGVRLVETRLSDGLRELEPGEADTVIIAGMGGELEIRILEEGRHVWDSVEHWILSPQSDLHKVRRFLEKEGFLIEDESMILEDGKYYTVMSVVRGVMKYENQAQYHYGARLIEKKDPHLKVYLDQEMRRIQSILAGLEETGTGSLTEGQKKACDALRKEASWIKEAQDEMQ